MSCEETLNVAIYVIRHFHQFHSFIYSVEEPSASCDTLLNNEQEKIVKKRVAERTADEMIAVSIEEAFGKHTFGVENRRNGNFIVNDTSMISGYGRDASETQNLQGVYSCVL